MTRLAFAFAFAVVALSATDALAQAAPPQKIAVLDVQRVMEESVDGKAIMAKHKVESDRRLKEVEQAREDLRKQGEQLAAQAGVLKPEVLAKRRQELDQKLSQWQETASKVDHELEQQLTTALEPVRQKMLAVVGQLAQSDGFTLVIRADAVVWPANPAADITAAVLRKMDQRNK
jgi:Skp family chaperone for outer membrane proteins